MYVINSRKNLVLFYGPNCVFIFIYYTKWETLLHTVWLAMSMMCYQCQGYFPYYTIHTSSTAVCEMCFLNQSTDMNKDERQHCVVIKCVIRLLIILGNPFYYGLCYALVEREVFPSDLSVSCYGNGTSKFKECLSFYCGRRSQKGEFLCFVLPYKRHKWTNALLFFKMIHYILHTFVTDVREFPDSICIEYFCLHLKPICTVSLATSVYENCLSLSSL